MGVSLRTKKSSRRMLLKAKETRAKSGVITLPIRDYSNPCLSFETRRCLNLHPFFFFFFFKFLEDIFTLPTLHTEQVCYMEEKI